MITYKNFIDCNDNELKMILEWRNTDIVRLNSFHTEPITYQEHIKFVSSLMGGGEKRFYFLINDSLGYLGVISLTNVTSNTCEIGYYKNPNRLEKGIGVKLLNSACEKAKSLQLEKVITCVINTNIASVKSMIRAGFIKCDEKINNIGVQFSVYMKQL